MKQTTVTTTVVIEEKEKSLLELCAEKEPQPKVNYTPVKVICRDCGCDGPFICYPKFVSAGIE